MKIKRQDSDKTSGVGLDKLCLDFQTSRFLLTLISREHTTFLQWHYSKREDISLYPSVSLPLKIIYSCIVLNLELTLPSSCWLHPLKSICNIIFSKFHRSINDFTGCCLDWFSCYPQTSSLNDFQHVCGLSLFLYLYLFLPLGFKHLCKPDFICSLFEVN